MQIDHARSRFDADVDFRMGLGEAFQSRKKPRRRQAAAGINPQRVGLIVAAKSPDRFVQGHEMIAHRGAKPRPGLRQDKTILSAGNQFYAEPGFQIAQMLADGARRHAQRLGRRFHAAGSPNLRERADGLQWQ